MWDKEIVSKSLGVLVFTSYPRKNLGIARIRVDVNITMRSYNSHPSAEELNEYLRYEPSTGHLFWKKQTDRGRQVIGARAERKAGGGYTEIFLRGCTYRTHNVVWIMNGRELPIEPNSLDHRDRDRSNNRIENLREATPRQQAINCLSRGFGWDKGKWSAKSRILDRRYIGRFPTALQARLAYEKATSEVEPEFASTFFTDAFNELIASAS